MPTPADFCLRCDCGAIVMELRGEPAARAICHCNACRELYGSIVLAATAWAAEQVTHLGDPAALLDYAHPRRQMRRYNCRQCGELVHGRNRLGMVVVPNARFTRQHDGQLPAALKPTLHMFYDDRAFDVLDDLPKYLQGWDGPRYR